MKFEPLPLSEAKGKILGHNIAGLSSQRLLRKSKPLADEDIETLLTLGPISVYVARSGACAIAQGEFPDQVYANQVPRPFGCLGSEPIEFQAVLLPQPRLQPLHRILNSFVREPSRK